MAVQPDHTALVGEQEDRAWHAGAVGMLPARNGTPVGYATVGAGRVWGAILRALLRLGIVKKVACIFVHQPCIDFAHGLPSAVRSWAIMNFRRRYMTAVFSDLGPAKTMNREVKHPRALHHATRKFTTGSIIGIAEQGQALDTDAADGGKRNT